MCYGYNRGKGGKKMKILEVKNLTKIYGTGENEVKALDHVSFSVEKGEFIAIVGSSGSGKSTLLHLIGGVDKPTSGEVIVNGINVYQQNEEQLEENMTLPVLLDNQKVNSVRLEELLKILDLTNRKNHLPKELSGGQQQRVSIGRALMNAPSLVLADEPTGNLDSKNSKEIIDLLKITQQKYKQTLIMITHDERIAMQADRVIVIEDGQIKKDEVLKK